MSEEIINELTGEIVDATAIAIPDETVIAVQQGDPIDVERAMARMQANVQLANSLRSMMELGEDYGMHPGYSKPCLEKPGAEKVLVALNVSPKIVNGSEGTIYDSEKGLREYNIVVAGIARNTGIDMGSGIGYARASEKDAMLKDKETGQITFRPDRVGWANNKAAKMAYKSAKIDLALMLGCLSGAFTQDVGDKVKAEKGFEPDRSEPSAEDNFAQDMAPAREQYAGPATEQGRPDLPWTDAHQEVKDILEALAPNSEAGQREILRCLASYSWEGKPKMVTDLTRITEKSMGYLLPRARKLSADVRALREQEVEITVEAIAAQAKKLNDRYPQRA